MMEFLLLINQRHTLKPYSFTLVPKPTHPVQPLKGLSGARKGLTEHQCHGGFLASVVNASHSKLILGYDKFKRLLV